MINCIVVEDERAAQEVVQAYIAKTPFLNCLGVYESGLDIPMEILQRSDFLFLDIQLPELNGLAFLKTLPDPPKVIITTAFEQYAIAAFEEAAVDYLVKPFSYERFFKGITRMRNLLLAHRKEEEKQLFLYADKTIYKVERGDVLFLKAEVDYVKVFTEKKQILILDSLRNWEEKLEGHNFIRIHRSYLVNISKVDKISGNQLFIDAHCLPMGGTYKNQVLKVFGKRN
ncbi:MAG: LytTR family DNA-binding domain-containing protein [Saonia sp.]